MPEVGSIWEKGSIRREVLVSGVFAVEYRLHYCYGPGWIPWEQHA